MWTFSITYKCATRKLSFFRKYNLYQPHDRDIFTHTHTHQGALIYQGNSHRCKSSSIKEKLKGQQNYEQKTPTDLNPLFMQVGNLFAGPRQQSESLFRAPSRLLVKHSPTFIYSGDDQSHWQPAAAQNINNHAVLETRSAECG
jgi:hypothetical protein